MIKTKEARDRARKKGRERMKKSRRFYFEQGLCTYCGKNKVENTMTCLKCRKYLKEIRLRNLARGICVRCANPVAYNGSNRCNDCIERYRKFQKVQVIKDKTEVMNHYGGKCVCCSESNVRFLTLDHTNNDGQEHRAKVGTGSALYQYLLRYNFQSEYELRVLCYNCNMARRSGDCPHENGVKA